MSSTPDRVYQYPVKVLHQTLTLYSLRSWMLSMLISMKFEKKLYLKCIIFYLENLDGQTVTDKNTSISEQGALIFYLTYLDTK